MYYLMEMNHFQRPRPYSTRLADMTETEPSRWLTGRPLETPPAAPLRVELWEYDDGQNGVAELFMDVIPLMRNDLIEALEAAGVDNLETFPAVLVDPQREGMVLENYRAVNIIGLVRCADLEVSQYDDITGTGLIAMGFRKLVIDEARAGGALFFRLAESVASVIVHQKVKDALPPERFPYLKFRKV